MSANPPVVAPGPPAPVGLGADARLRVLQVHNYYQQPGGEDQVFHAEVAMLRAHGHHVVTHAVHNDAVDDLNKVQLAAQTIWSRPAYATIARLVRDERIDVVHVHNTLPLVSQAAFYAARRGGAAVVQTLHNYRHICPNAVLVRDEQVCELCVGKTVAWPAVRYACYRGNRAVTAMVAAQTAVHRVLGTWHRQVDAFIALTAFARAKYAEGGLPATHLRVKPNFLATDPGLGTGDGGYALFAGRLTADKGVRVLLDAWSRPDAPPLPLWIAGDGPERARVEAAAAQVPQIRYLGRQTHDEVLALQKRAHLGVLATLNYEGCPMSMIEGFAVGTPIVGSDLGGVGSMIEPGVNGDRFATGDAAALARTVTALVRDADAYPRLRAGARQHYETRYAAEVNYHQLLAIYAFALQRRHGGTLPAHLAPPPVA